MLAQEQRQESEETPDRKAEVDLSEETTPASNKCELPADGVFKFGDLQKADISCTDVRGFKVELEDGSQVSLVEAILSEDDRILQATKGMSLTVSEITEDFPKDYEGTLFSDDADEQQKIIDHIRNNQRWTKTSTTLGGNDYSDLKQDKEEDEEDTEVFQLAIDGKPSSIEEGKETASANGVELNVECQGGEVNQKTSDENEDNDLLAQESFNSNWKSS